MAKQKGRNKKLTKGNESYAKGNKKRGNSLDPTKGFNEESREVSDNWDLKKSNHPSWYYVNEQLARDTASLPFGYQLGGRIERGVYGDKYNDYAIPGIMRCNYYPVYGWSADENSAINMAAKNMYTFIKSVNSRAKSYDSSDMAMYMISMDSALNFHAWMKRLYGVLNSVGLENRYLPRAMVSACGGNYDDLCANITQLRGYINNYALKLSAFPIPKEFSIFARHSWMVSHVWAESDQVSKCQLYTFNPVGFWKFGLDGDGAGRMVMIDPVTSQPLVNEAESTTIKWDAAVPTERNYELTYEQIVELGNSLISPILYGEGDEDFNIMGGDILYAYGEGAVYRADMINEVYSVIPTYDQWICDQITNLRAYGDMQGFTCFIEQDTSKGHIISMPRGIYSAVKPVNEIAMDQMLNVSGTDISTSHVLEASRLLQIPNVIRDSEGPSGTFTSLEFDSCGSEIVTDMCIYYYASYDGTARNWSLNRHDPIETNMTIATQAATGAEATLNEAMAIVNVLSLASNFDCCPLLYVNGAYYDENVELETKYGHYAINDTKNFTIIDRSTLKMMNYNVLLAMFGIDQFGNTIKKFTTK